MQPRRARPRPHELSPSRRPTATWQAFHEVETDFLHIANREGLRDGTTAVVALVEESTLTIAHVGDSRGVLCRGGNAVAMTQATTSLASTPLPSHLTQTLNLTDGAGPQA